MRLESEIFVWIFLALSIVFLIIIIIQNFSKKKLEDKLDLLDAELKNFTLEKESAISKKRNYKSNTNLDYIKKIESLENALKSEKKRVNEVKIIAQEANRVKAEFLANIRHEIRTPMNSVMVFAGLLTQELQDAKLQSYAQNINNSGMQLLNLLDDIIELSSVESNIFHIEEKATDIRSMLVQVVENFKSRADKKSLPIELHIDESIPESVMIDKERVEEILGNLVENAIHFTDQGRINISLLHIGSNILKNAVHLSFVIKDSGIGIHEEDLDRIFEIFEKPMQNDEKMRGVGLNLSINKKMANAMGGDITVESSVGKGSTFIFTLKNVEIVLLGENLQEQQNEHVDFSYIKLKYNRIVVIDRENSSKVAIEEAFSSTLVDVISYDEARDAISHLQKEYFDIIFIDVDILIADENAVAKILMKISTAPIVTLTTHRLKNIEFPNEMRLVGHLKKPIVLRELFKVTLNAMEYKKESLVQKDFVVDSKGQKPLISKPEDIAKFLEDIHENVNRLYDIANKTNDLASIEKFAKRLQVSSKYNNVREMEDFANLLVEKITLFDIEAMNSMMKEYQEKIENLKNF